MDALLYTVVPIIGGIFMFLIIQVVVRAPGMSLGKKFVSLGILKGKTLAQIVAVCGNPTSNSYVEGGSVKQWMATGYHIALLFDENDVCLGVSHEAQV